MWYTHTHTQGNVTQPQKACNLAICDNMDISRVYDAKGNKADGERQILLISFICEISKTKQGNKQKWKQIHKYKQVVVRGTKGGRMAETDEEN